MTSLRQDPPSPEGRTQARLEVDESSLYSPDTWAAILEERAASAALHAAAEYLADNIGPIWHWGDGNGGNARLVIEKALEERGLDWNRETTVKREARLARQPISRTLRKAVMERDKYRCVECGTHLDLEIDHIVPVSKGGTNDFENLRALCRPCNMRKGDR